MGPLSVASWLAPDGQDVHALTIWARAGFECLRGTRTEPPLLRKTHFNRSLHPEALNRALNVALHINKARGSAGHHYGCVPPGASALSWINKDRDQWLTLCRTVPLIFTLGASAPCRRSSGRFSEVCSGETLVCGIRLRDGTGWASRRCCLWADQQRGCFLAICFFRPSGVAFAKWKQRDPV
jgi:hypothetical protein